MLPVLTAALASDDLSIPAASADALGQMGSSASPAAGKLRKILEESDSSLVRASAAAALWRIEGQADAAVSSLTALLDDPDADAQISAVQWLGEMGPAAQPAVPALIRLLKTSPTDTAATEPTLTAEAQDRLTQLLAETQEAIERSDFQRVEELNREIEALTRTTKPARTTPQLTEEDASAGDDDDGDVTGIEASPWGIDLVAAAARAIRKIEGDEVAVTTLLETAAASDPGVSVGILTALTDISPTDLLRYSNR